MQIESTQVMLKGRIVRVDSLCIENKKVIFPGKLIKVARLEEEWYEDLEDPALVIETLRRSPAQADLLTFWQRYPETKPKHNYHTEWESVALLPIKTFNYWWEEQIRSRTRGLIRKAEKKGVVVREAHFNDEFIRGITEVFNETPIRQGKPFWHYGKDFETVKREFSRYLYREDLIGAYYNDELIGFMFLANAGRYVLPAQILSKTQHRDKATNNVLIAKAVEICDKKNIPYFVYFSWGEGDFAEFKRRNGFQKILLPRYYVPLTVKGEIILGLRFHRGLVGILPERLIVSLKNLRSLYYTRKYGAAKARSAN